MCCLCCNGSCVVAQKYDFLNISRNHEKMTQNTHMQPSLQFGLLQGLQQSLSPEIDPIDNVELYYPHDNVACGLSCHEYEKPNRAKRLSQALVHFVNRPVNVRSTNSCQKKMFNDNSRTQIGQFSNRFQLFLPEIMIVQARS